MNSGRLRAWMCRRCAQGRCAMPGTSCPPSATWLIMPVLCCRRACRWRWTAGSVGLKRARARATG